MHAGPVGRTAAPCVRPACLTTNDWMYLRPKPGQILDPRNLLTLSGDDCDVSRQSSPVAQARAPGPYADTYAVAVNLVVVESDGSRPSRPDYLRGGEQTRRHRAACNRGHGLLRCCVEFRNDPDVRKRPTQPLWPEDGSSTSPNKPSSTPDSGCSPVTMNRMKGMSMPRSLSSIPRRGAPSVS